jgi:hypothetical protein
MFYSVLNPTLEVLYPPLLFSSLDCMYYWVFGLFPSSGILENRKLDVSETGPVSVLR